MYGKIYHSTFTGSMYGAGAPVFAVWAYVLASMKPDKVMGFQVELNPKLLAGMIGDTQDRIQAAIDFLCAPDPESRTAAEDGRRLIKIGSFDYQVVNGVKYAEMRNEEQRRENNRIRQQRHRAKKKPATNGRSQSSVRAANESRSRRYVEAINNGDQAGADRIAAEDL